MSRTYKKEPPKWWKKENKKHRKPHYKAYRKKVNQLLRQGEEELPQYAKTEGHLTH